MSLFKRMGGLVVIQEITKRVFKNIEVNNEQMASQYKRKGHKLKTMSKKYAYFIACRIGMQKNWLGQDLACCHSQG